MKSKILFFLKFIYGYLNIIASLFIFITSLSISIKIFKNLNQFIGPIYTDYSAIIKFIQLFLSKLMNSIFLLLTGLVILYSFRYYNKIIDYIFKK